MLLLNSGSAFHLIIDNCTKVASQKLSSINLCIEVCKTTDRSTSSTNGDISLSPDFSEDLCFLGAGKFLLSFFYSDFNRGRNCAVRCDTVPSLVSADMGWSVLKTRYGQFLQIQMFESTLTLCVEDVQNEDENGTPGYWPFKKITSGGTEVHCDSLHQNQLCKTLQPQWA